MIYDFIMMASTAVADSLSVATKTLSVSEVLENVSGMSFSDMMHAASGMAVVLVGKIIELLLIWFVGRWVAKRLVAVVKKLMERHDVTPSVHSFVSSLLNVVTNAIIIIMIISVLGIDTSSFIALFASAGVAVGMALSGTLQNFAGGVIILLFRPFKVGDFIEAQGYSGTVKEIQMFNTVMNTPDNKTILLPNGPVSTGIINNYSREDTRRADMTFSISYGDDFEKAKEVLMRLIGEDKRILDNPAPAVILGSLAASSIDIVVKVWCKQADYWGIINDMNRTVYEVFPKEGLNFPFQTFTVNVTK